MNKVRLVEDRQSLCIHFPSPINLALRAFINVLEGMAHISNDTFHFGQMIRNLQTDRENTVNSLYHAQCSMQSNNCYFSFRKRHEISLSTKYCTLRLGFT